jgi:homeobox-leucine zipper protein
LFLLLANKFGILHLDSGFNEALNGFTDEGWTMMGNDGVDDVTILVNSSPDKLMGLNLSFGNGFPSVSNAVLCAKASMLLQVRMPSNFNEFLYNDKLKCY